ncbi:MAG: biotin/lipoyl-containing protein [Vicinamibacterales bacterium]
MAGVTFDIVDGALRVQGEMRGPDDALCGEPRAPYHVERLGDGRVRVTQPEAPDQRPLIAAVAASGRDRWVWIDGFSFCFRVSEGGAVARTAEDGVDRLAAPMPATVTRVHVAPGDRVARGQVLIVLEAMKMELPIRAPHDGTVTAVHCRAGELVAPERVLVFVEA